MKLLAVASLALAATFAAPAAAGPPRHRAPIDPLKVGARARVTFQRAGELRPARDVLPRRAEPLTLEEETAAAIQKLLRGPVLRRGVTGLFVADARTGEPLFAVNADSALNPASNVKLISTATALELLGPEFRYPTRLLGPAPVGGVVRGDVYLLGSYDPTLTAADLHAIAATMANAGITAIDGNITIGTDPTRDGIYRSVVPIEIAAAEPGAAPTALAPTGYKLVDIKVTATTSRRGRTRLTYRTEAVTTAQGMPRIQLTIGGTLGKGTVTTYPLWTKQRTANAAYALIAALGASNITVTGEMKVAELGDFIGDAVLLHGALPVELGRHESQPLGEIVRRVNKWSINWLADRVIMTAAALSGRAQPSMELALDAMYSWLARHPHVAEADATIDTGSGLSYRTEITPTDLVAIVRAAGGFSSTGDATAIAPEIAQAWRASLAISATDGTLRSRFKHTSAAGHIHGKTGTLSTAIALSGILDVDPARPLVFSLITNTDSPLAKGLVRKAHERVVSEICKYLAKRAPFSQAAAAVHTAAPPPTEPNEPDVEDSEPRDTQLDAETATSK